MYVVLMEQCKYIIFHSPKPITVCGLIGSKFNSIGRLVYKMSSSLQIQHFNKSFSTEDLFTSMKVISQRILSIFQFTCRILFCLFIYFWYFEVLTFCTGLYFLFQFPALFKAVIQNPQLLRDFVYICYYIKDEIDGCCYITYIQFLDTFLGSGCDLQPFLFVATSGFHRYCISYLLSRYLLPYQRFLPQMRF